MSSYVCGAGHEHPTLTGVQLCYLRRMYYGAPGRKPRRSHDEVVLERAERARVVSARREFRARKTAERAERRRLKEISR